jgi:hypothetical protein
MQVDFLMLLDTAPAGFWLARARTELFSQVKKFSAVLVSNSLQHKAQRKARSRLVLVVRLQYWLHNALTVPTACCRGHNGLAVASCPLINRDLG